MLISPEYAAEQRRMHKSERYGAASRKFVAHVAQLIEKHSPANVLDYGAGKQALAASLAGIPAWITPYDPGIPEISEMPAGRFDLVCCIDVLEHVEKHCLQEVLQSVSDKTGRIAFITIHTGPAGKKLSDGRNAHLIQKPIKWWIKRLRDVFKTVTAEMHNETTILAICEN